MKRMKLLGGAFVSILLLALVTSCGEPTSTPLLTPTPTPVPTSAPTATPNPFPGLSEWDLLIISDSSNMRVGQSYAKLIEADQHVKVRIHDCSISNMSIFMALQTLQNNTQTCEGKTWATLVQEAEVIIVFGNPAESMPTDGSWAGPATWINCMRGLASVTGLDEAAAANYKANLVKSCAPDTFALYKTHLGALFDKIFELHAPNPVIVRATDFYIPSFSYAQTTGTAACCSTCIEAFSSAIHQAAAEHKVQVASSFTALNGSDHQTDPTKLNYISWDGIHLSDLGAERVAQALQQTGYAYAGK